jgi:ribosomal protein S13
VQLLADQKLTDPFLIIKNVSQKASRILSDYLTGSELVEIRVHPSRALVTAALILHGVLAQKGYIVETTPSLSTANANHHGRNQVVVELSLTNRTAPKTAVLSIKAQGKTEKYNLPYNKATQTLFFFMSEEVSIPTDELRVLASATLLQHDAVPQDPELIAMLKGLGVQNCSSRFLSFTYAKNFSVTDSLVSTLKPFLPGISLENPEAIASELRSRGIDPASSIHDLDEQKLKELISYVGEKIALHTKLPVQLQKVFQSIHAYETVSKREYDLRMLAGLLDVLVEVNPLAILASVVHNDLRIMEAVFNMYAPALRESVKHSLQSRSIIASGTKVLLVEGADLPLPLSYIKDNLVTHGVLQQDEVILVRRDSKLMANCFLLAQSSRIQLKPAKKREEWCVYEVESEELSRFL